MTVFLVYLPTIQQAQLYCDLMCSREGELNMSGEMCLERDSHNAETFRGYIRDVMKTLNHYDVKGAAGSSCDNESIKVLGNLIIAFVLSTKKT